MNNDSEAGIKRLEDIEAIKQADLELTVTSATKTVLDAHHLKAGAIVCDVARPRDVSRQVLEERDDILVIEGGLVTMPGEANFGFDYGLPPHLTFGCMAETMILTLEGRFENYTLGRDLTMAQVDEIRDMAHHHGFRLAGLRSFDRAINDQEIESIKKNVYTKQL